MKRIQNRNFIELQTHWLTEDRVREIVDDLIEDFVSERVRNVANPLDTVQMSDYYLSVSVDNMGRPTRKGSYLWVKSEEVFDYIVGFGSLPIAYTFNERMSIINWQKQLQAPKGSIGYTRDLWDTEYPDLIADLRSEDDEVYDKAADEIEKVLEEVGIPIDEEIRFRPMMPPGPDEYEMGNVLMASFSEADDLQDFHDFILRFVPDRQPLAFSASCTGSRRGESTVCASGKGAGVLCLPFDNEHSRILYLTINGERYKKGDFMPKTFRFENLFIVFSPDDNLSWYIRQLLRRVPRQIGDEFTDVIMDYFTFEDFRSKKAREEAKKSRA
jgi:hypothetical protein